MDEPEDNPAVTAWRLKHLERTQAVHSADLEIIKNAISKIYGAIAFASILTPIFSGLVVFFVTRKP